MNFPPIPVSAYDTMGMSKGSLSPLNTHMTIQLSFIDMVFPFMICSSECDARKRAVAQGFSVHVWGTWGRRFKSAQPDILQEGILAGFSMSTLYHRTQRFIHERCLQLTRNGRCPYPRANPGPRKFRILFRSKGRGVEPSLLAHS